MTVITTLLDLLLSKFNIPSSLSLNLFFLKKFIHAFSGDQTKRKMERTNPSSNQQVERERVWPKSLKRIICEVSVECISS